MMDNDLNVEQQVASGFVTGISFNILTEAVAEKLSVKVIGSANEVTDPAFGLPNLSGQCLTCGAQDSRTCEGHFGLIKFPFTTLNPYHLSEVAEILNKICPGCKSIRQIKVKNANSLSMDSRSGKCKYCDGRRKDLYPRMKFKVSSKDIFSNSAIIVEIAERFQNKNFNGGIASDFWDIIPSDPQQEEFPLKSRKRILTHAQVHNMLKGVDRRFLEGIVKKKSSLFLNSVIVTPNCHRVTEFGHHMVFDERSRAYRKLVDFRGSANELSARVVESLKISKIRAEKPSNNMYTLAKSGYNDFSVNSSGLKFIKELLLGKRSDHAFRMVVVGDPNIKLDEIGLPCHIAERLQVSEHLTSWNWEKLNARCDLTILEKGQVFVRRKGSLVRISLMDKLQKGDTIYRPLNDGDIVLINRPPSIHQHSLIALSVKILPTTSVLSVNPLICSPFRGDFDGDCFHGYVPQSMDSRVELNEIVALKNQLINGQNGRNLLSLSHDSLTAAHLVLEDGVILNRFQMQQLQMFCPRQLPSSAIVKTLSNTDFWTGKQLFSMLLPEDMNYVFKSDGVDISNGELLSCNGSSWLRDYDNNLFHKLVKHYKGEVLDFLFAAQEVLSEWLSMRGLSVSLSDLYLCSDSFSRKNMIDDVFCGLQEAEHLSNIKLLMVDYYRDFLAKSFDESEKGTFLEPENMCSERQKSAALGRISVSAFKQVFWDIQNLIYQYAHEDNSLLAMLKAGSKGNLVKLVQHCMCLGLQQSVVPLSFRVPHRLSCEGWNNEKTQSLKSSASYIPCAVVESSFLNGLNPLECFVHSLTSRDGSFSGHADISGTLNRKIMFFMRDLYVAYDGTVRNAYGDQIVQFSYNTEENCGTRNGDFENGGGLMAGDPVGSLAACAISEAAYGALDQPVTALESSPLLKLKKILDCGIRSSRGEKTASLFLSKKLGRWAYGFEYGALEVKNHLERVLFSDIVSTVKILYSHRSSSLWVCHFSIRKDTANKRRLNFQSVTEALKANYNSARNRSKINLPSLKITKKKTEKEDDTFCIIAAIGLSSMISSDQLAILRDSIIPFLLQTVIKGFSDFKKVDILWKDWPKASKSYGGSSGELYLSVFMSENGNGERFWSNLVDSCLPIIGIIDWDRSHPDSVRDMTLAYGIDVARKYFLTNLKLAISDTGKTILPEHLHLAADCLSATGEFVALNAKGLAQQRKLTSVSSPFTQACFSNPSDCFIKAAKMGIKDDLKGVVDSLSWGKTPPIGTGGQFDIIYSGKGHEIDEPEDVYNLLSQNIGSHDQNVKVKIPNEHNHISPKSLLQHLTSAYNDDSKGQKLMLSTKFLRKFVTRDDIRRLSHDLKNILNKYAINVELSDGDKSVVMMALCFHPRMVEKIGSGGFEVKVGYHSEYQNTRCFLLVRKDGTVEDFSYHKCVHHALELIAPHKAKTYQSRWLKGSQ